MIYYFSGTGNSKWAAETLAAAIGDSAASIAPLVKSPADTHICIGAGESIGLVFPIYAWGAPKIVNEFTARLSIDAAAYVFAVCTCGSEAGLAMNKLKRRFPWKAAWSLSMPNNYLIMGSNVDPVDEQRQKIDAAAKKLVAIARSVRDRTAVADVHRGGGAWLKSNLICPFFRSFAASTKPFSVDENCTGCGLCEKMCPRGVIRLTGGKPVWNKAHCLQCMACINRCPAEAIQYGEETRGKGRYYFEKR